MNYLCLVYLAHDQLHACADSECFAYGQALARFYLIDAKDLNEVIHWAFKIPLARFGSVEVRPMRALDYSPTVPAPA